MDQSEDRRKAWGQALKAARRAKGLSQLDICRETGAAPAAVYRWEAGRVTPQMRFLKKLRELFPELSDPPRDAEATADGEDADAASCATS